MTAAIFCITGTTPDTGLGGVDYRAEMEEGTLAILQQLSRAAGMYVRNFGTFEGPAIDDDELYEQLAGAAPAILVRTDRGTWARSQNPRREGPVNLEVLFVDNNLRSMTDRLRGDSGAGCMTDQPGVYRMMADARKLLTGRRVTACGKPLELTDEGPISRGNRALTVWRQVWVTDVVLEQVEIPPEQNGTHTFSSFEINPILKVVAAS